jgi:transposase
MKKTRDIVRLRRWCMRRRGEGAAVREICASAQIPRRTFYNWWNRYRLGGLEALNPMPRIPHTIHRTPPEAVEKILALRREKGWCPILIEGYLRRVESIQIGHTTIHRLLKQAGLNNPLQKPPGGSILRQCAKCYGLTHSYPRHVLVLNSQTLYFEQSRVCQTLRGWTNVDWAKQYRRYCITKARQCTKTFANHGCR